MVIVFIVLTVYVFCWLVILVYICICWTYVVCWTRLFDLAMSSDVGLACVPLLLIEFSLWYYFVGLFGWIGYLVGCSFCGGFVFVRIW